jgi:hypothetical protein
MKITWPDIGFGPINLWNMPKLMDSNILYERLIEENMEKGFQVRLVVNDFKETIYIQLRKYFLTYEGDWQASREGVSIPASTENIYAMLDGLFEICSKAEGEEIIKHYADKISQK